MRRIARSTSLAFALICAARGTVRAGDAAPSPEVLQRADAAFSEGKAAYARKDFAAAAEAFERANQVSPHGRTSYLAGLSWLEAGDPAHACDALERSLSLGGLRDDQAADAKRRLAGLDGKVGRVRLRADKPARGAVDTRPDAPLPIALCLTAGAHEARAVFEGGGEKKQSFEVTAGGVAEIELTAPVVVVEAPVALPTPTSEKIEPRPIVPLKALVTPPVERESSDRRLPYYVAGGIAFGLSAVSIGTMAGLGSYTLSLRDDFIDGGQRDPSQRDAAVTARTLTNVALGFGCAFAATGVILFAVAPREPDAPPVSMRLGPSGVAAVVRY